MTGPDRPRPMLRGEEQVFYDHVQRHELVYHRCEGCSAVVFPLRTVCPSCGGEQLALERSSRRGVIHSFTVQHRAAHPFFGDRVPYALALTDLDEGFRLLTSLPDPGSVAVGTPVEVVFEEVEPDRVLLQVRAVQHDDERSSQ